MRVVLLCVGRTRGTLAGAVGELQERAERYWNLEVVEVDEGAGGRKADPDRVREAEAERLLARLPPELEGVALTRTGKGMTSRGLASWLQRLTVRSAPGVAFVVGGAFGLHDEVLGRCPVHLSLSPMTLPHEIARLVLTEQLYRAGSIRRGEPYHKGAEAGGGKHP